jgi:dUTP pyrophosphatase
MTTPTYKTLNSAAADLTAAWPVEIPPLHSALIDTGVYGSDIWTGEGDQDYCGLVLSRSGLAFKGIVVLNSPGLIDPDYTGEIKVNLYNTNVNSSFKINKGDSIAQLLIVPFMVVSNWPVRPVERGDGGHGSTGR